MTLIHSLTRELFNAVSLYGVYILREDTKLHLTAISIGSAFRSQ